MTVLHGYVTVLDGDKSLRKFWVESPEDGEWLCVMLNELQERVKKLEDKVQ